MTPTIATFNGEVLLAAGSPGGSSITGAVFNVLVRFLELGAPLQSAVDAPRGIAKDCSDSSVQAQAWLEQPPAPKCVEHVEPAVQADAALSAALVRQGFNLSVPDAWPPYPGDGNFHAFGAVQALCYGGDTVEAARKASGVKVIYGAADTSRVPTAAAIGA